MFDMKKKAEDMGAQEPKNAMKKPADEISEEALRGIVGGLVRPRPGDAREGISEASVDQGFAAGQMNDVDGWE